MAKLPVIILSIISCFILIHGKSMSDESCSASCDKSFGDHDKSLACKRGCRFYSLIHLVSPSSSSKNLTAESCVLACREASELKDDQDTCTVGCTLQRIFVTKSEEKLSGQPLIDALLEGDDDKLASEEIIKQFVDFSTKVQLFAAQLVDDFFDEDTMLENGGETQTVVHLRESEGSPKTFASLNVRTYSVADDGRVTLVDELNREYTFVYSCFSLQIDAPFQRRMKQLIAEPIRTFKRLFSFSRGSESQAAQSRVVDVPGGTVEIKRTNVLQLTSGSDSHGVANAQMDGVVDIGLMDNMSRRDFDWFFCVAARNTRLHCILLGLFALSCIGLLCACWVSLGHFSGGRKVNKRNSDYCDDSESGSECEGDEDEEPVKKSLELQLDLNSPLAPPPYVPMAMPGATLAFNDDQKKEGAPTCVNDDVLLCVDVDVQVRPVVQHV